MKVRMVAAYWVLGALGLGGCYNSQEVNQFLQRPRAPVSGTEYRVLPPDVIAISSRHVPEITGFTQQIRPDGKLNLPLVGEIYVAKKTPQEIEKIINDATKDYYEQVDVTVTVAGYNSQKYFVFGEVSRPGPEPWTGHDTLLDALAKAQPTFLAWPERIIVVRGDAPQEGGRPGEDMPRGKYKETGTHPPLPGDDRRKMTINMMATVKRGDLTNNILLEPNDVIYVQPNPLAVVGEAFQSLLLPIRPAMETAGTPYYMQNYMNSTP